MSEKTDLARVVLDGLSSEATEAISRLDPDLYYRLAQQAAGEDHFEPQAQVRSRSQMTRQEKQDFIAEKGYDAFMALGV